MLQWTGGSRRKVTTSRKSTESRQKQYFEQRRRLEQTVYPQNSENGNFRQDQQPKEHRSLDIQSLLNLSIIAKKSDSARTDGDDCLKVNNSKINYQSTNFPTGKPTNVHILTDPVELKGPGNSQCNAHTVSPEKGVNNASSNQGKGTGDKMKRWNVFSEQHVSVLDLLDTDGTDRDSDFNPVTEDHVAFSVDEIFQMVSPLHQEIQAIYTYREIQVMHHMNQGMKQTQLVKISMRLSVPVLWVPHFVQWMHLTFQTKKL